MPGSFEHPRHYGQPLRDITRNPRGLPRRIERQRVQPNRAQALADGFIAQIGKLDAMRTRVGKRRVGCAGARELSIEFDHVADIDHQQKRRTAFGGGQCARILLGLPAGAQQRIVESFARLPDLLRFEYIRGAAIAVDKARRFGAVTVAESDAALEHVGVVARVLARRVGRGQVEQRTQFMHEQLIVGALRAAGGLPACYEALHIVIRGLSHCL